MLKNIPITEASDEQLRDFAEKTLMLDIAKVSGRDGFVAALSNAWSNDYITIEIPDAPEPAEDQDEATTVVGRIKMQGGYGRNDPKWTIKIGSTDQIGGKQPVPVNVNGAGYLLQRDMAIEGVPHRVVLALQNAKTELIDQAGEDSNELIRTTASNYPFEVLKRPTDEEIAAWHERTRDEFLPA